MSSSSLGVADVDIDRELRLEPFLGRPDPERAVWSTLVHLHGRPLGTAIVAAAVSEGDALGATIYAELGTVIEAHLRADGLPAAGGLDRRGLGHRDDAACLTERRSLLEAAPLISVVVPTRDRPAEVARCVGWLLALDYPNFEVIVVDNSTDDHATPAALTERFAGHPQLRCISQAKAGTSRARNRGTEVARGDIVAFVDDDVWVDPLWLTFLTLPFAIDSRVACVTGLILPAELETAPQRWFEELGGFDKGALRRAFTLDDPAALGPLFPFSAGMFGSGANMAFRREELLAAGGFDTRLGGGSPVYGGEDLAAFIAILAAGHRLLYEPAAVIRHWHRRTLAELRYQQGGYGRGLGAHLIGMILDRRELAAHVLSHAGPALLHLARSRVLRRGNPGRPRTYPRSLDAEWFAGLVKGVALLLWGRVAARGRRR